MNKTTLSLVAALAIAIGMGIWYFKERTPTAPPAPSQVYNGIDVFLDELAHRVSEKLNPGKEPDFKVVVAQGSFEIGTVLRANSTIPMDYTSCLPAAAPPSVETSNLFPTYALTSDIAADFGLDKEVIGKLADAGVQVSQADTVEVSVQNSHLQLLSDNDVKQMRNSSACRDTLANEKAWLVRGYIIGQRNFSTAGKATGKFNGQLVKVGSFNVNFGPQNASVALTDDGPKKFLQLISEVVGDTATSKVQQPTATPPQEAGRVYVQQDKRDVSGSSSAIIGKLAASAFSVEHKVESIDSARMPSVAQVRYFNDADKGQAEQALSTLKAEYPDAKTVRIGAPAPKGQLEVWLPKYCNGQRC